MKRLKIEEFIKPMKALGATRGKATKDSKERVKIDLEDLTITYGIDEFQLDRIAGTKGGYRYFFLCPQCGRRCRVVYKEYLFYACGECQGVYKTTRNRTKTNPQYYWERALRECRKVDPTYKIKGYIFNGFPERPKRMRWEKWFRHYTRFLIYLNKGDGLWMR